MSGAMVVVSWRAAVTREVMMAGERTAVMRISKLLQAVSPIVKP